MSDAVVKLGADQVEKAVMFAMDLINCTDKVGRDTSVARWGHLIGLAGPIAQLTGLKIADLKAQLADLDSVERADIFAKAKVRFDIADDVLESTCEEALDLLVSTYANVVAGIALAKRFGKKD